MKDFIAITFILLFVHYAGGTLTPHAINSAKGLYSSGKNLLSKPNLSASARAAVEKWMETLKDIFKRNGQSIDDAVKTFVDFTILDIPNALTHVKFRDLTAARNKGIVGCHDATEFAKVRQVSAIGTPNYQVAIGKTLDEVEEIVILKDVSHSSVYGVRQIEYKIPAVDAASRTTGALKSESFTKTIYDPAIWNDSKLEQALKEAIQYVVNKNPLVNGERYQGLTREGYTVEFWYRDNVIQTFYFL